MDRMIGTGLGLRPDGWWRYESGRPDLVPGSGEADVYAHLRDPDDRAGERAAARLRFLAAAGQLTKAERMTIDREVAAESTPARWAWRAAVLHGLTGSGVRP
jgi:hypothetical protein